MSFHEELPLLSGFHSEAEPNNLQVAGDYHRVNQTWRESYIVHATTTRTYKNQ